MKNKKYYTKNNSTQGYDPKNQAQYFCNNKQKEHEDKRSDKNLKIRQWFTSIFDIRMADQLSLFPSMIMIGADFFYFIDSLYEHVVFSKLLLWKTIDFAMVGVIITLVECSCRKWLSAIFIIIGLLVDIFPLLYSIFTSSIFDSGLIIWFILMPFLGIVTEIGFALACYW